MTDLGLYLISAVLITPVFGGPVPVMVIKHQNPAYDAIFRRVEEQLEVLEHGGLLEPLEKDPSSDEYFARNLPEWHRQTRPPLNQSADLTKYQHWSSALTLRDDPEETDWRVKRSVDRIGRLARDLPNEGRQNAVMPSDRGVSSVANWALFNAYDCTKPAEVKDESLWPNPSCLPTDGHLIYDHVNITYTLLHREEFQTVQAWKCLRRITRNVAYCGHYDHVTTMYSLGWTYRLSTISAEHCQEIINENKYHIRYGSTKWTQKE
ncbi:MAG: hypothetical protein MI867_14915, partial [Pseudomonadales bacterium]|nr:hypothetical protein [Pseudomonadales bacterium]